MTEKLVLSLMFLAQIALCQENSCNNVIDTSACYTVRKYSSGSLRLERKVVFEDSMPTEINPLFADFDGDCQPECILPIYTYGESLRIVDTKTGITKKTINTDACIVRPTNLAVADIDLDGVPEIFVANAVPNLPQERRARIACYDYDGNLLWLSDDFHPPRELRSPEIPGNLSFADFNQDGIPEVYVNNRIFNAQTGNMLLGGVDHGLGLSGDYNYVTIAGQLDDDPSDLEIAAGYTLYKVEINNTTGTAGNTITPVDITINGELCDGKTAMADIDLDGQLDIIVLTVEQDGLLYAYSHRAGVSTEIAHTALPPNSDNVPAHRLRTSAPVIGNVDGTDTPSVIVVREDELLCYKLDASKSFQQIWSYPVEDWGGFTSLTLFDFDGDGIEEMVHRDERFLRIISGKNQNPELVDQVFCGAQTYDESPIVVDAFGEGTSNICVPCGDEAYDDDGHLTIFGSPDTLQPWAPARNVWNQYAYHVYNINDDLTVPRVMKNNATEEGGRYNGFMMQQSLLDTNGFYKKRAASLHGLIKCVNYDIQTDEYEIIFDLYNRSDASLTALAGFPVGFFDGDPQSGGTLLGVYTTTTDLPAGDSLTDLSFTISGVNFSQLFMMVNSDETTFTNLDEEEFYHPECDFTDNLSSIFDLPEVRLLEDSICAGENYVFLDTTIMDDGIYFRELQDQNGCDSVCARLELKTIDSVHVVSTVMQCDSFVWKGELFTESGTYSDQFVGNNGCDSTITLELTITKSTEDVLTVSACDYYLIHGDSLTDSGSYSYSLTNAEGCDSTLILELTIHHAGQDTISRSVCQSFNWKGNSYDQSGFYRFDTLTEAGCDSTITLALEIKDTITTTETINICEGDSVLVFGDYVSTETQIDGQFVTQAGCDSIHTVRVEVDDVYRGQRQVSFCEGDSVYVIDRWISSEGQYEILRTNSMDCDSVIQITAIEKSTQATYDTLDLCEGDTLMLFGQSITTQTDVDQIYTGQNGCDSTAFVHVTLLEVGMTQMSFTLCPQDSVFIHGQWIKESMEITETMQGENGCDSLIRYDITQIPSPDPPTAELNCENGTVEVRIDAQSHWRIEWDNGDTTSSTIYQNAEEATVRLTTSPDCELEYTIDLPEIPVIGNISFPRDTIIARGTSITIDLGLDPSEWKVQWSPREVVDCDNCMQVTIRPGEDTRVIMQLTHISGCTLEAAFRIDLEEEHIYVPNVFSPNGDGINDGFRAFFTDNVSILSVEIYDRWGELIYRSEGEDDFEWDGTFRGENAQQAVYTYKIEYSVGGGVGEILAGDVTLLR